MKTKELNKIPLDLKWTKDPEEAYIKYDGKVLLIRHDENGSPGRYQFDGTSCLQGFVQGHVIAEFETKSKWFSSEWWYRCTSWFKNEGLLYFTKRNDKKDPGHILLNSIWTQMDELSPELSEKERDKIYSKIHDGIWSKMEAEVKPKARPSDKCLKAILDHVSEKIGIELQFPYEDMTYGKHWWEANVPVKIGKEIYLLTWENCD